MQRGLNEYQLPVCSKCSLSYYMSWKTGDSLPHQRRDRQWYILITKCIILTWIWLAHGVLAGKHVPELGGAGGCRKKVLYVSPNHKSLFTSLSSAYQNFSTDISSKQIWQNNYTSRFQNSSCFKITITELYWGKEESSGQIFCFHCVVITSVNLLHS